MSCSEPERTVEQRECGRVNTLAQATSKKLHILCSSTVPKPGLLTPGVPVGDDLVRGSFPNDSGGSERKRRGCFREKTSL